MFRVLTLALVVASCAAAARPSHPSSNAAGKVTQATVYQRETGGGCELRMGVFEPKADGALCAGRFEDGLDVNGWGVLNVVAGPGRAGDVSLSQARKQFDACGLVEGRLTRDRIYQQFLNMYEFFFPAGKTPPQALYDFLQRQSEWTAKQISIHSETSGFWGGVSLIDSQFEGLFKGYNWDDPKDGNYTRLPKFAFQLLNGVGDFLDLLAAISEDHRPDFDKMTPHEVRMYVGTHGMCSGMIKVNGDLSQLWMAHSSWFTFGSMNRIYKHYNFAAVKQDFISAQRVSFSSYPGFLESLDDFYIMSNGLGMVQTTNSVYNHELYKKVHPESLFAWQRVRLACQNAHNGKEWSEIIATHNSGTYNNQYMVVDYNKFKKGAVLEPGILWVSEQIPGLVEYGDMTHQLERGYWASYNVPYFESVYNQSGYPEFVKKHGVQYSYQMAPRAEIFRRDAGTVTDMDSFKAIMRYNDYKKDPYSHGNPGDAICSRFDLEPENPQPFGCYDTKVTCADWIPDMHSQAINGPTRSHGIPAFSWSEQASFNTTAHFGVPQTMDFDFLDMQPISV